MLVAACSGDGGSAEASGTTESEPDDTVEVFCSGAQALYDQFVSAGASDPTSPAMQDVYAGARSLDAPDEIAADWQLILDSLEPLMTGQVDIDDPAAMRELNTQATANAPAYDRVGTYVGENCEIEAATTTTTAPEAAGESMT
ncbi:MAG: hypothetical protein ACRD2C_01930 [Acidimicrobiales bacterium]